MNRYISYPVLLLVAALVAACSSSEDMIGNEKSGGESSTAPLSILGAPANGLVSTGASYGPRLLFRWVRTGERCARMC